MQTCLVVETAIIVMDGVAIWYFPQTTGNSHYQPFEQRKPNLILAQEANLAWISSIRKGKKMQRE